MDINLDRTSADVDNRERDTNVQTLFSPDEALENIRLAREAADAMVEDSYRTRNISAALLFKHMTI